MNTPWQVVLLLRPSRIHGVGVFAAVGLRRGTKPPLFARSDWRAVGKVAGAGSRYAVSKGRKWWVPANPHRLSVGWYLNHSTNPNVDCVTWRTLRYIPRGHELTINYEHLLAEDR